MRLLKEIKDGEIPEEYNKIFAVRIVLFDDNNKVALINASKENYHKLPGGRIEEGEDKMEALKREVLEETGLKIEVQGVLGEVKVFREKDKELQTSYCYYGSILEKGENSLTEEEKSWGFEVVYVSLDEAIELVEKGKPAFYQGKFIVERDSTFLKKAQEIIIAQSQRKRTM